MREPRDYQREAAVTASERNYYIAFQCGLGKSLAAVEACKLAKRNGLVKRRRVLIVVSPKVALEQWRREIQVQDPGIPVYLVTNEDAFAAIDAEDESYVVSYYEMLLDKEAMRFTFLKLKWGVVVADEAHKVKNRDSQRYAALRLLDTERKICMSGTPYEQTVAELWAPLHWLDGQRFSSFWKFVERYVQTVPGFRAPEFVGVKPENKAELSALLRQYMMLRTRKQVGQNVQKIVQVQRVTLGKQQRQLYNKVRRANDVVVDIGTDEDLWLSNAPTTGLRLLQLASWPGLLGRPDLPSAKLDWVLDYIANNPNEPMLLFTRFQDTAIELHRRIEAGVGLAKPISAGLVVGGRKPLRLNEVIGGKVKYLVGTIAAVGTALDLPMLTTAIFVEMEWSSILMRQAADRIHRMTTVAPPNIIFLLAQQTVDWLPFIKLVEKLSDQQTFELMMHEPGDNYPDLGERAAEVLA